jgi:SAM-dependent methyltransferase
MQDYGGWIRTSVFQGESFERLFSEVERYQATFLARHYSKFQNGEVVVNGKRLYTGDHTYGWSRQYEYPYILANMPQQPGRVLDVGSGFNFLPFYLKEQGHEVVCVDIEPLEALYEGTGVQFKQDNITESKLTGQFDVIYSVSVLEHIPNREAALANIQRLLADGGRLILTLDCDLGRTAGDSTPTLEEVYYLVNRLNEVFGQPAQPFEFARTPDLVTTRQFMGDQQWRLPWRKPSTRYSSGFAWIKRFLKAPYTANDTPPSLGVFAGVWHKQA